MIYVVLILFGLLMATFIFAVCQHGYNKSLKQQLDKSSELYIGLQEEFELFRNTERFKAKKEEELNEKVNDLHNGTVSADDILPKR